MKTIYKYPVLPTHEQVVDMPKGAIILSLRLQNSLPYIWAIVDPDEPTEPRQFYLVVTGEPLKYNPTSLQYIGTVLLAGGRFVYHLFERV